MHNPLRNRLAFGPAYVNGWLSMGNGKVGAEISVEGAYGHARRVTLNPLAAAEAKLGSIDAIDETIKILGFVNAAPEFDRHPAVINGYSELLVEIFGLGRGAQARSAIGRRKPPFADHGGN